MLEACFADLLKGLVIDDEVMDWIVDALHWKLTLAGSSREVDRRQ